MGYGDWVCMHLTNLNSNITFMIQDLGRDSGKWYAKDNKDDELKDTDLRGKIIAPNSTFYLSACGNDSAAYGTEGWVKISDTQNPDVTVTTIKFSVPYSGTNTLGVDKAMKGYTAGVIGSVSPSGAIGDIEIDFAKLP